MKKVTINKEQGLYLMHYEKGVSCLGFDILINRLKSLSSELGLSLGAIKRGSIEAFEMYQTALDVALHKNIDSGWRSTSELTPSLIGLEGKRVEGIHFGERIRFIVGKSMGYIPAHLIIKSSISEGGGSISPDEFKFVRVI